MWSSSTKTRTGYRNGTALSYLRARVDFVMQCVAQIQFFFNAICFHTFNKYPVSMSLDNAN